MTADFVWSPRPQLGAAAGRQAYIDAAVASHMAHSIADRAEAAATATRIAARFGLREIDLESDVLDAVAASMTTADLEAALASPVTRRRARAELTRRSA